MPANLAEFLTFAHTLANAADMITRRYFRADVATEHKADASPVTIADREVEETLRRMITERYPEHGIFGEEFARSNVESDYQWVIDPIDGTRAFMAGYSTFTTLISLAQHTLPQLGIISQSILRERWAGMVSSPSALNGKPINTRKQDVLKSSIIASTSIPYYFDEAELNAFERLRKQCGHTVIGGDGYGYAMLATGQIDVFCDVSLKPYDFCALVPVIEGAGGVITDWQGQQLTINSKGDVLAAGSLALHAQALELIHG